MPKIAIVIPFYQEEFGILRRCLASVFGQQLAGPVDIAVLVVDDASPADPAADIKAAGEPPSNMVVQLIRRPNGGPAAARNTGLDHIGADTDFVALLDSDDTWQPEHLQRAIDSLEPGFDVYFADHLPWDGKNAYLPTTQFYDSVCRQTTGAEKASSQPRVLSCDSRSMAEFVVTEYLAHTSSIVYRASKLGTIRMSEALRAAGEDHLFFLDLVLGADKICFSLAVEVALGDGVNLYGKAFLWGSERDLRRRTFILATLKIMRRRSTWMAPTRRLLARRLATMRRTVGFLLFRRFFYEHKFPIDLVQLAWKFDRPTVLFAPVNALWFAILRLVGHDDLTSLA